MKRKPRPYKDPRVMFLVYFLFYMLIGYQTMVLQGRIPLGLFLISIVGSLLLACFSILVLDKIFFLPPEEASKKTEEEK